MVVYFGDEVADALENYIEADRKVITPLSGHEEALFLSTQRKRMGVQAIENMVKKYARQVTPNKKITPHSFVVPMARRYIRKLVIFILWQMSWGIKMLIRPKNIMQLLMKTDAVWRLRQ